eukprot:11466322-Karenia_brevis.AAC.1
MCGKKLAKAFQQVHAGETFHLIKKAGIISKNWLQVARINVDEEHAEPVIKWHRTNATGEAIDKNAVVSAFEGLCSSSSGDDQWYP